MPDYDFLGVGNPVFNKWVAPLRDNLGNSTCYGSGYVLRRSALDAVGGWPLVPVGEDIYFGFLLAGQGWEIASCRDILQYTLAPESLDALFKQRMRWVRICLFFLSSESSVQRLLTRGIRYLVTLTWLGPSDFFCLD